MDSFYRKILPFDFWLHWYSAIRRFFEPGEKWRYDVNMDWTGWLNEKITGQNLEDYIREHIADPLQMKSPWFKVPDNLKSFHMV